MTTYRIQAMRDEQILERGTAWFVDTQTVVTAFHVVGDPRSGEWLSTRLPGLHYQLLAGDEAILLEPLSADDVADVALLKPTRTLTGIQIFPLAEATLLRPGATWYSAGFPAFHDGVFGLSGTVTRSDDTMPAQTLQLTVDQGTQVDWGGISGAPIWIDQRAVGLITRMTSHANTGWAVSANAIRVLYERPGQASPPQKRVTRSDLVRRILQELSKEDIPGVALLEPLRFDARSIVQQVMQHLQDPARHMLVVQLVPNPHTTEATYLYGALYRDLKRGIQQALGAAWSPAWSACFEQVNDTQGRAVAENEFQWVLEALLDGPVRNTYDHLVLIVEGLSTVKTEHVQSWGWLLQRLSGPLKLLVRGGEELYQLCTSPEVGLSSVFHQLARLHVEPFSQREVTRLMTEHLSITNGATILYDLTHGHPALVYEASA